MEETMKKLLFNPLILSIMFVVFFSGSRLSGVEIIKRGGSDAELERAKQMGLEILSRRTASRNVGAISDFQVLKIVIDDLGMMHVRVRQTFGGVPVWTGEAIVHLKADGSLSGITDDLKEDVAVGTKPKLSAQEAVQIAAGLYKGAARQTAAPKTDLWIYRGDERDYLVYRVEIPRLDGSPETSMPVDFIDAQTGEKVFGYDNLQSGVGNSIYSGVVNIGTSRRGTDYYLENLGIRVGTVNFLNDISSSYLRFVDSNDIWTSSIQNAGVDAHYGAEATLVYYQFIHGRNGLDGNGGPAILPAAVNGNIYLIASGAHFGSNYNGSGWTGEYAFYGDGDFIRSGPVVSLDTCGHELTHGVVQSETGMVNWGESGALNESLSDIFGTMVERLVRPSAWNWKWGEEPFTPAVPGDAVRYLDNPHFAIPQGLSFNDDPDHYSERYTGLLDNGGVHANCGIANYAFYLAAAGGTHHLSEITVQGIGVDDAAKIWYRALTLYMNSGTNFAGARAATLDAARDLFGSASAQYASVSAAWCAVGVGTCSTSTCVTKPISYLVIQYKNLQSTDCTFPNGSKYDAFTFNGTEGAKIYIKQKSTQFDAFLNLYSGTYPDGTPVASDNNGGGGTNARIPASTKYFTLPTTGLYTIVARSQSPARSGFYSIYLGRRTWFPWWDKDDDGKTDLSVFGPPQASWKTFNSSTEQTTNIQFGSSTDKITPADFSGDGNMDIAVWRPANGSWYVLRSEDNSFYAFALGAAGDVPAPGDFDGDGIADAAVFRPANATWYISLSNGGTVVQQFGANGDVPVVADYDGDERSDIAVFRPANGQWWINGSNGGTITYQFGTFFDKPVQGDYDGDRRADVAVFRPASSEWFVLRSIDLGFYTAQHGAAGDIPAPADYDGDGKYDFTVFRPSSATWFIRQTSNDTLLTQQFGASGDIPVTAAYIP
jgi:Zn-dependent metalloprotease